MKAAAPLGSIAACEWRGDLLFAAACGAGAIAVLAALYLDLAEDWSRPAETPPVAVLVNSNAEVRRRPACTLLWDRLIEGDTIHSGDSIFVPPSSDALVMLEDGSRLELDQNTLIVFERRSSAAPETPKLAVALTRGSLSSSAGPEGLSVLAAGAVARLQGGSDAVIHFDPARQGRIDVFGGEVQLESKSGSAILGVSDGRVLDASGARLSPAATVSLDSPERNARLYFRGTPGPVVMRWTAGDGKPRRVEVARDRSFLARVVTSPLSAGSFVHSPKAAGTYYWRVGEEDGRPASLARRFVVVEDRPPLPTAPSHGAVLSAGGGRALLFAWTRVPGVRRYAFEVAAEPSFKILLASDLAEQTAHSLDEPLGEGTYYWRIRALEGERGVSPYSNTSMFRLTNKPLLGAPELLNARVELE